jgi:HSP20 family molecular chaperone IbpA
MPDQYPLKKGQEVFVKRPVEIYGSVVGPRDWGLPDDANVCCVELKPATQYYLWDDLEASQRPKVTPARQLDLAELEREISGMITRRAYELFESGGYMHGRDREDWLRAESEILLNVPVDIRETETELMIRADVPGFSKESLEVQVEPRSIGIAGKRQQRFSSEGGKTVYSERSADQIFRVLDLPSRVDPKSVDLFLGDGILEVTVLKSETSQEITELAKGAAA